MPSSLRSLLARSAVVVLALAGGGLTLVGATGENWTPASAKREGYSTTPVWSDEFNGAFDQTTWTAENKAWTDNSELQYYSSDSKYVGTSNGELQISATSDANGGRAYTSGRISTQNSMLFKHGLFAARMKMTKGQGIWPAFWLFGTGTKYSEIDIAELVGGNAALQTPPTGSGDDSAYGSLCHFATEDGKQAPVTQGPGNSHHAPKGQIFADDYHVFWLEWTDTEVYSGFDEDDQQLMVADISQLAAFQAHMYIILNVAIGGDFPGAPDATTVFPQTLEVDWVRVYNKNGETITQAVTAQDTSSGNSKGSGAATLVAPLFSVLACAVAAVFAKML